MKNKKLKIQPVVSKNVFDKVPYPYFVDEFCQVLRQDFWQGKPKVCMGFCHKGKQKLAVSIQDIFEKPEMAKTIINRKLYPVFIDNDGHVYNLADGKFRCSFVN